MYSEKSYAALFFDEIEEYQELEAELERELISDPHNKHILNNLGLINFEAGDIKKSESYLELSSQLGDIMALETLCDLYAKTERISLAINTVESLIPKLNESYKIGIYHRKIAQYYIDSGTLDLAIESYQKSLQVAPEFNRALLFIAETFEKLGQKDKGREYRVKYGKSKLKQ